MARRGENIYKRKDGRWEGRYIKGKDSAGKAIYGYVYSKTYNEIMEQKNNTGCSGALLGVASLLGGIAWLIYAIMIWMD